MINLKTNEEIKTMCDGGKILATILNKISDSIDDHDKRADERGSHVRSEHEKMINNLEEQGKILARINGIKQ